MRVEPWLQAGKYVAAVTGGLAKRNGWTIAEQAGDRTPVRTQRLLNRAVWDTFAAMGVVRRFAVAGLDEAAQRRWRRGGLAVGTLDETRQQKHGTATAGGQTALPGVRGQGGERDHYGAPVVCARADRARADRRPALDPGRAHR